MPGPGLRNTVRVCLGFLLCIGDEVTDPGREEVQLVTVVGRVGGHMVKEASLETLDEISSELSVYRVLPEFSFWVVSLARVFKFVPANLPR